MMQRACTTLPAPITAGLACLLLPLHRYNTTSLMCLSGLLTDTQRTGDYLEVPNASDHPERSMSFRSMTRTPSSKYRDSELVSQSRKLEYIIRRMTVANLFEDTHGEMGPTIDEVLASNEINRTQEENKPVKRDESVGRRSISSDLCISPSWSRAAERRRRKKEEKKKMEKERKEKKELERKLKQEAKQQAKQKSRASSREPRKLQKRTPPVTSSRASSAHSRIPRPSTESSFTVWSRRTSGVNSINEQSQDEAKKKSRRFSFGGDGSSKDISKKSKLAGVWPRRYSRSDDPSNTEQIVDLEPTIPDNRRSLHTVKKHTDLRALAREKTFEVISSGSRDPEPGFVHLAAHRNRSSGNGSAENVDETEHAKVSKAEGSLPQISNLSNGPRFPFQSNSGTESRRNSRARTGPSEVVTQSTSLGSQVLSSTDPGNALDKAKRRDYDRTLAARVDKSFEVPGLPLASGELQRSALAKAARRHGPFSSSVSMMQPADIEPKDKVYYDAPYAKHPEVTSTLTPNGIKYEAIENSAQPPKPSSSTETVHSPRLEQPPLSSGVTRGAKYHSSPLAKPPLVVQTAECSRETSNNKEQGQYTIEAVQNPTRQRRTSFKGYLESKGVTIPRLLGDNRKEKNAKKKSEKQDGPTNGQKHSSFTPESETATSMLPVANNRPDMTNGVIHTSRTTSMDSSMPKDAVNTAGFRRYSNETEQKSRPSGEQRERLRKRTATVDLSSKAEERIEEQIKDTRPVEDQNLKRIVQSTAPQIPLDWSSPRHSAKPAKKPATDDTPVARSSPIFSPIPEEPDHFSETTSALNLHQPANTPAEHPVAPRTVGQQFKKLFVICCQCKHWHDMTFESYKKFIFSPERQSVQKYPGFATSPEELGSPPLRSVFGTPSVSANSSRLSLGAKDGKAASRPNTGMSMPPLVVSTVCCWCWHTMERSCCDAWSAVATMDEHYF